MNADAYSVCGVCERYACVWAEGLLDGGLLGVLQQQNPLSIYSLAENPFDMITGM